MKIKRFLSVLLSILLVLSSVPVFASAATSPDGYLTYVISGGGAEITDCDTSISGDYIIPSTLGGYSVISIPNNAFFDCASLTSIFIPDSVTFIGNSAFGNCASLKSITVDANNEYYSSDSQGVLYDKDKTNLMFCPRCLTSFTIPNSVTCIGGMAFYGCESLTSVIIPDSVTTIDDYAFLNCTSLANITIPDSVTSIGIFAFDGCTSLTSITIPDSVTEIAEGAFSECSSLEGVTIGNGVTTIGGMAFLYCTSLTSIFIPDSVTSIGESAFDGCESLESITIGKNVKSIGWWVFTNTAYYNDKSNWDNGVLYIDDYLIAADTSITGSCEIKAGTKVLASEAFADCSSLSSVTIPDSVISLGQWTFAGCASLKSVNIPDNITVIDYNLFSGCLSLASITISNNITSIRDYAFFGCNSLKSVTIPGSVTSIGSRALGYDYDSDYYNGGVYSDAIIIDGFTIYGYDGTAAETYANENGITFISLGEYIEPTTIEPTTAEPTTVPATTEPVTADGQVIIILGDVNGDNKVTAADARLALRIAAKLNDGTDKELAAADLDGNGKVATSEARTILRMAALLEESMGTIVFGEPVTTVPATEEPATAAPTTAEPTTAESTTAEKAKITAEVTDACVGEEVEVTFSVENFAGAECGVIYFTYDPDALEFVSAAVHNSTGMESFAGNDIYHDNRLGYGFMFLENSEDNSAEFLSVTFKALKSGDTTVTWEWDEAEGIDVILNGSADLEVISEESTTAETTTVEPTTVEPTTEELTTAELTTSELTTEEPTTEEPTTEEPTTEEPATEEPTTEEPAAAEIPEGAVAYSEFPDEMKAFIEGKFGFSGTIDADGSSESVTLKTDGKNIKM
ncbi:MAG: leucine-rich repeat protein, partial [Clostridiales bacterium]|nr:leucine-rich repeat protein [Clostridiales bacterium]